MGTNTAQRSNDMAEESLSSMITGDFIADYRYQRGG